MKALTDPRPQSLEDTVQNLVGRVAQLEQRSQSVSAAVVVTTFPGGIGIGEPPVRIDPGFPLAPIPLEGEDGLKITPGIFRGEAFADVEWADAPGSNANTFDIEWVEEVEGEFGLPSYATTSGLSFRITGLKPNATYGARVRSRSRLGEFSEALPSSGYEEFDTPQDTIPPTTVQNIEAARGATSIVVMYDPNEEEDVAFGAGQYQVQIDQGPLFTSPEMREIYSSATIVAFNDLIINDDWYVRVRAIDSAGNPGPWSPGNLGIGPIIAGGVIDEMVISGLNAAKITFGEMSGDRIQANTITANKITTSSLTAANITLAGGSLRAGSDLPNTGIIFSSQGLRSWKAGVLVMDINALTGDATFNNVTATGIFQTANSGLRIRVGAEGLVNVIRFYSGMAGEWAPGEIFVDTYAPNPSYPNDLVSRLILTSPQPVLSTKAKISLTSTNAVSSGSQSHISLEATAINLSPFSSFITIGDVGNASGFIVSKPNLQLAVAASLNTGVFVMKADGQVRLVGSYNGGISLVGNGIGGITVNGSGGGVMIYDFNSANHIYYAQNGVFYRGTEHFFENLNSSAGGGGYEFIITDTTYNRLYMLTSTKKNKKNIRLLKNCDQTPYGQDLYSLKPRSFNSKLEHDGDGKIVGLVAEEVAEIHPDLVTRNREGEVSGINWPAVWTLLIASVQDLDSRLQKLEK